MIMKFIISLGFILMLSVSGYSQSTKKVKNFRIKSTTEWITMFNDNEKSEQRKDVYIAFDKDGNTIEKTEYNKDGSIKKREISKYDNKGNLLEESNYEAKHDKENKDSYNKKVSYKYNTNNDKTEENVFDSEGKLIKKTVYTYNRNGDKSAEVTMDSSGKVLKKAIYTYDSKGLKSEKKTYNGENTLESVKKYEYTF